MTEKEILKIKAEALFALGCKRFKCNYKKFEDFKLDKEISKEEFEAKFNELKNKYKTELAQKALYDLCDMKLKQAEKYIAKKEIECYIEKEYNLVKEALNNNNVSFFEPEALLLGTTAKEEFDKALKMKQAYEAKYNEFATRIRAFRRAVTKLIETGKIDKANKIINKAKEFGADTSNEDIKALFEEINE
jgi:hypothetical protein